MKKKEKTEEKNWQVFTPDYPFAQGYFTKSEARKLVDQMTSEARNEGSDTIYSIRENPPKNWQIGYWYKGKEEINWISELYTEFVALREVNVKNHHSQQTQSGWIHLARKKPE